MSRHDPLVTLRMVEDFILVPKLGTWARTCRGNSIARRVVGVVPQAPGGFVGEEPEGAADDAAYGERRTDACFREIFADAGDLFVTEIDADGGEGRFRRGNELWGHWLARPGVAMRLRQIAPAVSRGSRVRPRSGGDVCGRN